MRTTLLAIIIVSLIIASHCKIIEIDTKYLIITTLILIVLTYNNDQIEGLNSNEALQGLSSVYNSSNAVLQNLQITGTLRVGNNVLISADPAAQDKIQIYQNGDGKAPYFYYNKGGSLGIWDGAKTPVTLSPAGTNLSGNVTVGGNVMVGGDAVVGGNLVLDGTNKWILHTPDDGRKILYVAPWNSATGDWNWNLNSNFDGNTGKTTFPSATIGGDAVVGGNLVLDGTNKWILHTPDDGRKTLYVAPWNSAIGATGDWNWNKSSNFNG